MSTPSPVLSRGPLPLIALWTLLLVIFGAPSLVFADLPSPKTGGPDGGPISILVFGNGSAMQRAEDDLVDAQYRKELTDAGYQVTQLSLNHLVTPDYLSHFGTIIVTGLPFAGAQYQVGGDAIANVPANLKLLQGYVASGGAMVVIPAMSEFGEAYADTYNRFLAPFDVRLLPLQLRDDAHSAGGYAQGIINSSGPIGTGLKDILYPTGVMRWDNAYSTTPVIVGKDWTVVAKGQDESGTHQAIDNEKVGKQLTTDRNLFAYRKFEKGYIAVTAIHGYYSLSCAYAKVENIGENHTGMIAGAVLKGTADGRKSELGALMDQTLRYFAQNSTTNHIGSGSATLPPQPALAPAPGPIDWHAAKAPPTWRNRYNMHAADQVEDTTIIGNMQYFKALVGPRTSISSGKGTVKEYRAAALAAGYSTIAFCETFEDIDPTKWDAFVKECEANSDDKFVCLPGLDIKDFQGGRYLVIGAKRFPDESWLSKDHKTLVATRMLSLGWYGHIASVHRCTTDNALNYKMYKQYQGITVYTYDATGKLVDDSLTPYQWAVASDSNPIPITCHELTNPSQVATAAGSGFQQIMPGTSVAEAVDYFTFGFPHYFDCPLRYFISEGPILTGWSILNKDLGSADTARDHYRLSIGIQGDQPIASATLYDGFNAIDHWTPKAKEFTTDVDGFHDAQHLFLLMAQDQSGKRLLSPGIRTTTRNWRLRCGDRQNWLGCVWIYTGWNLNRIPSFILNIKDGPSDTVPIFDYTFFSNHVQIADADLSHRYINTGGAEYGGDAKPTFAVTESDWLSAQERYIYFSPVKQNDFGVMLIDVNIKLKRDVKPSPIGGVFPLICEARENNQALILPDQPATTLSKVPATDLPVGSYAGGVIPLTPGLCTSGHLIGFKPPAANTQTLPAGTTWHAQYLIIRSSAFTWRSMAHSAPADAVAEKALVQMGLREKAPYSLDLTTGKMEKLAYIADVKAENGRLAGSLKNEKSEPLLFSLPLRISGLSGRCATALWRSDTKTLDYFGCYDDKGYVTLNADKPVDFYAGNIAQTDPALGVDAVIWNDHEAWFRINNPTDHPITSQFITAPQIKGFKPVNQTITIPAGTSIDLKQ